MNDSVDSPYGSEIAPAAYVPQQDVAGFGVNGGQDLNQLGMNSEASLLTGPQNFTTQNAIAGSVGVGQDQQAVTQAAADFARLASQAIANGQPLDQVRFSDPALTDEARTAIYTQAATQAGTTPEQIKQKADEAAARDMAAVQGMMGGLIGGAAVMAGAVPASAAAAEPYILSDAQRANQPSTTEEALAMMGADIPKTAGLPGQARSRDAGRSFG